MQNLSYTYDKYLICMGLGPSILSVIDESPSYSGPSYPSSPVVCFAVDDTKTQPIGLTIDMEVFHRCNFYHSLI